MTMVREPTRTLHRGLAAAAATESPTTAVRTAKRLSIAEDLLDGGEIVLLAIKPSPWFVVFDAARWLLFGVLLIVASAVPSLRFPSLSSQSVAQLACLIIVARLTIAFLRWVSRFYVLTNRRVMRLRGVFKADILSCPLLGIRNTRTCAAPHERLTKLGNILFFSEGVHEADLNWYQIARCDEIHARVRRAIERAIDNQS